MKRPNAWFLLLFSIPVVLAGCSGTSSNPTPPTNSSAVSVTITDAPPSTVAILSFEVDVTGATLNPGGPDLLAGKAPVQIEVKRLEVETAFISTANVPSGSGPFTGLTLAFANAELTFQNISASAVTFGTCANVPPQGVCELKPATTGLTANVNLPAPLTIGSNSPLGLKVDVNLTNLISSTLGVDFGAANAVTVAQSQLKAKGELEDIDDVFGTVKNKNASVTPNMFDLVLSTGNALTGIQVNSNTEIEDKNCTTQPPTFAACIQNNDLVEVDIDLMPGGVLVAKKIEKENEAANDEDLEGILFKIDTATNTFQMVAVEDNSSSVPATVLGTPVTISAPPLTTDFRIDNDGLNVCGTCSFNDINAMQVGQNVQVRLMTPVTGNGSSTSPFVVNRVRLRMSRFTATVSQAPSGAIFNATPLSGSLLAGAGLSTIKVDASQAEFENVSGVSALNVNDIVSLRGLLFKNAGSPPAMLLANKVRKRQFENILRASRGAGGIHSPALSLKHSLSRSSS